MNAFPLLPSASGRVVLALAPDERAEFLPGDLGAAIEEIFPAVQICDPSTAPREGWPDHLRALAPEVLVTGWQTPPLPETPPATLRYVCHLGGSVRALVARRHLEAGLIVTNWGGAVARTVAEGALSLILAALRRTSRWALRLHRDGGWREPGDITQSLFERRVGLHGFGATARELVRLLAPFGNRITVHAPGVADDLLARHGVTRASSFEALFAESDVVVELAPMIEVNRGIVTGRHLRLIPAGGLFVNVARGPIVDEADLLAVAREGTLQIALDVYHAEPLPADSPLRGRENVTLLPHVAGPTNDRRRDAGALAVKNLRAYRTGRALEAQVTPEIYDAAT